MSRYQGLSADRIEYLDETGVAAMRDGGTIGIIIAQRVWPAQNAPPVELLRRYQVPVAVAAIQSRHQPFCSLRLAMVWPAYSLV